MLTSVSLVWSTQLLQWRFRLAWARQLQRPQDTTQTSHSASFAKNKMRNCLWGSELPTVRFWNSQERGYCDGHYPEVSRRLGKLTVKDLEAKGASWHGTCYPHTVHTGMCKRGKRGKKIIWLLGTGPTEKSPLKTLIGVWYFHSFLVC